MRLLLLAIAFLFSGASLRAADPAVWSALVFASNEEKPADAPAELRKFKTQLEKVFGYNQLELVGQHTEKMDEPREHWLVPSKKFCLRVDTKTSAKSSYVLDLELYHEKRKLADFEASLGPESPLFIRGPLCARGQLIIVMMVK